MSNRVQVAVMAVLLLTAGGAAWADNAKPGPAKLIAVPTESTSARFAAMRNQVNAAVGTGYKVIIFRFRGVPLGYLSVDEAMTRLISSLRRKKVRTVAFVETRGTGVAVEMILACDEIVMASDSVLGNAVPAFSGSDERIRSIRSNYVNTTRARLRVLARKRGYPELLAEAMVVAKMEIIHATDATGKNVFFKKAQWDRIAADPTRRSKYTFVGTLAVPPTLVTITADQALAFGFTKRIVDDEDALKAHFDFTLPGRSESRPTGTATTRPVAKGSAMNWEPLPPNTSRSLYRDWKLPTGPYKVGIIPTEWDVSEVLVDSMQRRTDKALADGCTLIIYDLTTYGGDLFACYDICQMILSTGRRVRTVCYIPTRALSAGAFIAIACQEIVFGPNATTGSSAVISGGQKMEENLRRKIEADMDSLLESMAETNGYPAALCRSMSLYDFAVYAVENLETGETHYFEEDELPTDGETWDLAGKKRVITDRELLNMNAREATEYAFASAVVSSREELLARYKMTEPAKIYKPNWAEHLAVFLTGSLVTGLLVIGLLIGLFVEIRTPGIGAPALLAVACFLLLAISRYATGLAQWWEIAAIVVGVGLLFVELFVTPGFGVLGITGILSILFGLIGLFIPAEGGNPIPWPQSPYGWGTFTQGMIVLPISFAVSLATIILLGRFLPKIPLFGKLVLATADAEKVRVTAAGVTAEKKPTGKDAAKLPRVGQRGVVKSVLRPAGTVEVDERLLDVVCDGDFVEPGERVRIAKIEGNRIIVEKVDK